MKTSALTGPALDWAVATCEGRTVKKDPMAFYDSSFWVWEETPSGQGGIVLSKSVYMKIGTEYAPSTDWALGGPIIERERLCTLDQGGKFDCYYSRGPRVGQRWGGPTPLIAAMRCFVFSKLGDEVEVPVALLRRNHENE